MNIISKENQEGRLVDGIRTILSLSKTDFDEVLKELQDYKKELKRISFWYITDSCEVPKNKMQLGLERVYDQEQNFIGRGYFGGRQYYMSDILQKIDSMQKQFSVTSKEYERISELLATRNLQAFKKYYGKKFNVDIDILNKLFEILQNQELLEKFMNFEQNAQDFSVDGISIPLKVYLENIARIFGSKNTSEKADDENCISTEFYIKEIELYKSMYKKILERYNLERYVNPKYEFRANAIAGDIHDEVIRHGEEPDWKINDELRHCVYDKMPDDLSIEEKAMYIYCKLCKELKYEQAYFYRKQIGKNEYNSDFSKERLESIVPNSRITCFDFARVFSKLVNELEGDIEAVIISKGMNQGHFLTGFYTDRVSVMLEAINGKTLGTNDLLKAKTGVEFEGIHIISDKKSIINKAMEKVYPLIFEEKSVTIDKYVEQLRQLSKPVVPTDFVKKVESFIQILKERKINGNEAVQLFLLFNHFDFFGENVDKALIGKKIVSNGKIMYQRNMLLRNNIGDYNEFYMLNTETLELQEVKASDVRSKMSSGEYIYENKKQHMEEFDMGEK